MCIRDRSLEPTTQAPPLISRILPLEQSRLNVAVLYEKSADTSAWTYAHEFGRGHVDEVLACLLYTSLLHPLAKLHLPVHELAMMMTIALRFIPTLIEETDKIMTVSYTHLLRWRIMRWTL